MNGLDELLFVCRQFQKEKFDIEQLQRKIEWILLPDGCTRAFAKCRHNAAEYLEAILYCYQESGKKYADQVVDWLIQETIREQERFRETKLR